MVDKIKIFSYNVNGMVNDLKRRKIYGLLRLHKADIILLQETHCTESTARFWKSEWGGEMYYSNATSASGGVMLLLCKGFDGVVNHVEIDNNGRMIIAEIVIEQVSYVIANIYAPNEDNPDFFVYVKDIIDSFDNRFIIWTGDFNTVLDVTKDRLNSAFNNVKAQQSIKTAMTELDLCDVWRTLNPDERQYTWSRAGSKSRIDMILLSASMLNMVVQCDILYNPISDHNPLLLLLKITDQIRGQGLWKLNTSHLSNIQFLKELNIKVDEVLNITCCVDPCEKWEFLKLQIRTFCIVKSKEITAKRNAELIELMDKSKELNLLINQDPTSRHLASQLERVEQQIESIMLKKAQGAKLRCKTKWYEEGQRSSKYFFSLEKANAIKKQMHALKKNDGTVVTSQQGILQEQVRFYQELYTSNKEVNFALQDYNLDSILTEHQKAELEKEISLDELSTAVQTMPNNKTPGCDGLPIEIYKVLWPKIKEVYFEAVKSSVKNTKLMPSARKGVITLMPKIDRNILLLKNWRSLTMLNVDYKIVAKALASRMKTVLPDVIDKDQTGFMRGRNISTNIRKYMEVIEYCKITKTPAIAMSIDFEKCFDLLEHESILQIMHLYNFGPKFINMVRMLFTQFQSCIQSNGHISEFFPITRSTFQGSPISSFLFLLCGQLFSSMIKRNARILGIPIHGSECIISQFADDTDLFLLFDQLTLTEIEKVFHTIYVNIGIKVNYDKTLIYRLGSIVNSNAKLYTRKPFNWTNAPPNVLGINFVEYDDKNNVTAFFVDLIQKSKDIMNLWQNRYLSLSGKVLIVNTLIASLFVYKMTVLPNVKYALIQQFETIVREYIGKGNIARISLSQLQLPRGQGGLRLVDLFKRQMALKAQWVVIVYNDPFWQSIAYSYLNPSLGERIWQCNISTEKINQVVPGHSFWSQVLYAWCMYNFHTPLNAQQIQGQVIWYNSHILVDSKMLFNLQAWNSGLIYIADLIDQQGLFKSYEQVVSEYGNVLSWYEHIQIIFAIPFNWKQQLVSLPFRDPEYNDQYFKACQMGKITQLVYSKLISDPNKITDKCVVWERRLNITINVKEFHKMFSNIIKPTISTKLRDFQFRLLHNVIVTNHNLFTWKLRDDDRCTFCADSKEHTLHLFCQCRVVSAIWNEIRDRIISNAPIEVQNILDWSESNKIFNLVHPKPGHIVNMIILITKQYIYRCRCFGKLPVFEVLNAEIQNIQKIEYTIAKDKGKLQYFYEKWSQLYSDMVMSDQEAQNQRIFIDQYLNQM